MTMSEQDRQDRVAGQVVIVTGGGGVIGAAICTAFGRAGARGAVADLAAAPLTSTVASIAPGGGHALGIEVYVTDRPAVERALDPVDLLVNNAGLLGAIGSLRAVDPED